MIFLNRRRRGEDPHLAWKVRLFFLGAALALVGMVMDSSWLIGAAVAVLIAGVGLRFLPVRKGDPQPDTPEEGS